MIQQILLQRLQQNPPKTQAGNIETLLATAEADRSAAEEITKLSRVLDLGCGYGRLGLAFAGTDVQYVGIDVSCERLNYAIELFDGFSNCKFELSPAANARYNAATSITPLQVRLDASEPYDAVFAISLFTHMANPMHILHYLHQIHLALKPDGALLTTWLVATDPKAECTDRRSYYTPKAIQEFLWRWFTDVRITGIGTESEQLRILSRNRRASDVAAASQNFHRMG